MLINSADAVLPLRANQVILKYYWSLETTAQRRKGLKFENFCPPEINKISGTQGNLYKIVTKNYNDTIDYL